MTITLPSLPYDKKDLEPFISENTLNFHHGKHHQTYVTNLNNLIADTDLKNKSLEEIINISRDNKQAGIFNNAAQIWNHTFYWNSMKKNGGGKPAGKLLAKIEEDFGSFDKFVEEFKIAGATQFGSGWAWLVAGENNKLQIIKTPNAETPLGTNLKPLITMDVWEHAYYLDFQNARPKYIETFLNNLVNWDFALENLEN
ncbi:superoxide dismutase [Rickettsiales bacterium]|nr:superoxide dismutase [Rickettsiales bacterium]